MMVRFVFSLDRFLRNGFDFYLISFLILSFFHK